MKRFSIIRAMIFEYLQEKQAISGYAFMKYCRDMGIPASSGTIYPYLRELKEQEVIKEIQEGKRKIYTLTPKGSEILQKVERKKLNPDFKKLFLKFMYHLENTNWRDKSDLGQLLQDLHAMEDHLQNFLLKEDRHE